MSLRRSSPRDILPLDIAQFLIETHHLTPTATHSYIHLQIHYWRHGALPNDASALAAIAQISVDAWSIAQASLMHLFSIGPDGLLHQAGTDHRRLEWFAKAQRAKEKARKAANARWAKHWSQRAEHAQEIMHAQASAKHAQDLVDGSLPSPLGGSPHTPFLEPPQPTLPGGGSRRPPEPPPPGTGARGGVMPVGVETEVPAGASWLLPEGLGQGHRSVSKAKQGNLARTAARTSGDVVFPHPEATASARGPFRSSSRHFKKPGNLRFGSEPADPRFEAFSEEIFAYWSGQNPNGGKCPWIYADQRALSGLLRASPDMTLEEFKRLLQNRAASGLNPAALPRQWIGHIQEFGDGPLDRFKRPARSPRVL